MRLNTSSGQKDVKLTNFMGRVQKLLSKLEQQRKSQAELTKVVIEENKAQMRNSRM